MRLSTTHRHRLPLSSTKYDRTSLGAAVREYVATPPTFDLVFFFTTCFPTLEQRDTQGAGRLGARMAMVSCTTHRFENYPLDSAV
jgi:hypothetical protein